jgi:serine/threonine protein kinase
LDRAVAASSTSDDPRVTQALEEYLDALEAGQCPDRSQLQARYPDIANLLADYLDGLEFLHQSAAEIQASSPGAPCLGRIPGGEYTPTLEDYQILREIGRGGMGIVYEAEQRSLHRCVALKVLPLGATLDPRHLQRFKNEAQAIAQLQHPNIVPVYAVGCEKGVHYYAMRFIEGQTLRELIRKSRIEDRGSTIEDRRSKFTTEHTGQPDKKVPSHSSVPPVFSVVPYDPSVHQGEAYYRQAAWIGVQAAEALEHAHQMGVIHRDVKPANLLVDDQGQVWVTDFGLAHWTADAALTRTGDMLGTLPYMSPEQASAQRGLVDHRTDIYSLGATLYELVTLRPVCHGDQRDLLHQILHEDPVPPRRLCRSIPLDLDTILLKALGKRVEERYATAQDMADDLRRFLDGRPVLARRPGVWERVGKWSRRHLPVVVSAAALLILSVLGLSVCTVLIGHEQRKTLAAYENEARARHTEQDAREKEAEARARAEENFHNARRLLDDISEIAAVDMAAGADLPAVRRKLLQAALGYYEDFLKQHNDNQLTREELLRGHTRVATILEAIGRPKEAQLVWNQAINIALTIEDGQTMFHLVPANRKLRLLTLATIQKELRLNPQQVRAVNDLEVRRNKLARGEAGPAPNDKAETIETAAVDLLKKDQARRLKQLLVQQAGLWAFQDPVVREALQLTPAQEETFAAFRSEFRAVQQKSDKMGDHERKWFVERFLAQLNREQRTRWVELVGEPFSGVLPPSDLTLNMGRMVIQMSNGDEEKKGDKARPGPIGRNP